MYPKNQIALLNPQPQKSKTRPRAPQIHLQRTNFPLIPPPPPPFVTPTQLLNPPFPSQSSTPDQPAPPAPTTTSTCSLRTSTSSSAALQPPILPGARRRSGLERPAWPPPCTGKTSPCCRASRIPRRVRTGIAGLQIDTGRRRGSMLRRRIWRRIGRRCRGG